MREGLEVTNDLGNIELKYIADPTKHISDYSTNLLGVFEVNHIEIYLTSIGKEKYSLYCSPNETVSTPEYEIDFLRNSEKRFFTIRISLLNNQPIPYELDEVSLTGKCIVRHTPMKWNFWHFSIHWLNHEGIYLHTLNDKEIKKGWGRQLSSVARAYISELAELSVPEYPTIPAVCYCQ